MSVTEFEEKLRKKRVSDLLAELKALRDDSSSLTKQARAATSSSYYDKKLRKNRDEFEYRDNQ